MTETTTIELTEEQVNRLLNVLSCNVAATGATDAVRWTKPAASRIDSVRQEIADQTQ